jgi:hypothetical protein
MKTEKEEQIKRATFDIQAALYRIDKAYETINILQPLGTQRVVFASASFLDRLNRQAQLLPLSSQWSVMVNEMILSKKYGGCLIVSYSDFPEANLWRSVYEFLACVINFRISDLLIYMHASGSFGENIVNVYFNDDFIFTEPKQVVKDIHQCDFGLFVYEFLNDNYTEWGNNKTDCKEFRDYKSPKKSRDEIKYGDIATCSNCGQISLYTLNIPAQKLLDLYESCFGKIDPGGGLM